MGYVKNAIIAINEAGCVWVDEDLIERARAAGHEPQTRPVSVECFDGTKQVEALPAEEAFRLLSVTGGDDHEALADALAEML